MEDRSLRVGDAFALLNGLRSAMLTLCNMYITGVGVFVVASTTLEDRTVIAALTFVTAVFMIGNYVGFTYNFASQKAVHDFLLESISPDKADYKLVEDGKPLKASIFSFVYLMVSLVVLMWAVFYFQYRSEMRSQRESVEIQSKVSPKGF
jgi:hypothetical protein